MPSTLHLFNKTIPPTKVFIFPHFSPPITASAASKLRTHQNSSKLQQISELFPEYSRYLFPVTPALIVSIGNALLSMFVRFGDLGNAWYVFGKMEEGIGFESDVDVVNALIPCMGNVGCSKCRWGGVERVKDDPKGCTKNWNGDNLKVCSYKGIACAPYPSDKLVAVAGIDLNGCGLNGYNNQLPLSDFLEKLEDSTFFHANPNNFTGVIPKDISKIPYFYELDLSNKNQTVTFLDLRFNNFHDKVPPHVFNLDVDVLFINNNYFYDTLPSNLGNTPALYLTVANNLFNGPIPQSIGNAKDTLVEVLFLGNKLDGCLPYEIGLLKNAKVFDRSKEECAAFFSENKYHACPHPLPHLKVSDVSRLGFHFPSVSRPPITASAASKLRTHQNSSKLQQISELFAGIFTLSLSVSIGNALLSMFVRFGDLDMDSMNEENDEYGDTVSRAPKRMRCRTSFAKVRNGLMAVFNPLVTRTQVTQHVPVCKNSQSKLKL
ncbi:uncharacterized protein CFP56_030466 [Quercus suber]|uniref:Uncharacterized protein n=1 Tax=Quercus suber TaxID=58331 RepID=A0AAW0JNW1_QUESU